MSMLLGVAREIITPQIGACLYGYRPGIHSTVVKDDLTAIAFYFKKDETEALWISVTVGGLNTELHNAIRKTLSEDTGVPFEHIIISATHTHSAPNTVGEYGWGEIDAQFRDEIYIPGIRKAVKAAKAAPVEVEMGIGIGNSDIGVNRREVQKDGSIYFGQNPWGCYNPQMTVLAFRDTEHKSVANIIHYGMHGTCAGCNTEISRDWSGIMCDALESKSGAITAFFNGPEGDVGPRLSNGRTSGDGYISVLEIGSKAGLDAVNIYNGIRVYGKPERLAVCQDVMALPLDARYDLEFVKMRLRELEGENINILGRMRLYFETVLESYVNGYEEKSEMLVPHNFLVIGDVAVVSFPYELFSEIGLRIAKFSPYPYTLSLACSNGAESYFATQTELCRGGYEIDSCIYKDIQPMANNADDFAVKDSLATLRKLYGEK